MDDLVEYINRYTNIERGNMRNKIILDTMTDAIELASIASSINGEVTITDNNRLRVNAKSVIGAIYALEFSELWLESDTDIFSKIRKFIAEE